MDVWRDGSLGAVLVFILSHVCLYYFFHYSSVLSLRVLGSVTSLSFLALYLCNKEKQRTEHAAECPAAAAPPKRPPKGTRHPSWFRREWDGFGEEEGVSAAAAAAASYGATSVIVPQRQRTTLLRLLFLVLAAATPYYIFFLTTWMWKVFGGPGLLFAFAEVGFTLLSRLLFSFCRSSPRHHQSSSRRPFARRRGSSSGRSSGRGRTGGCWRCTS